MSSPVCGADEVPDFPADAESELLLPEVLADGTVLPDPLLGMPVSRPDSSAVPPLPELSVVPGVTGVVGVEGVEGFSLSGTSPPLSVGVNVFVMTNPSSALPVTDDLYPPASVSSLTVYSILLPLLLTGRLLQV